MKVVNFPTRLPRRVVERLSAYDQAAHKRGITTVTIEIELAIQEMTDRLRTITSMPELMVFGGLSNPLAMYFGFETKLTVEEVLAETIAIRKALAKIGVAGMAIEEKENVNE